MHRHKCAVPGGAELRIGTSAQYWAALNYALVQVRSTGAPLRLGPRCARSVLIDRGGRSRAGAELGQPPVVDGRPGPIRTHPLEDRVDEAHEFRMRLADAEC